ncbi:DUF6807 domain-containing protein [Roseiconus lacunae]|uniref:PmoA family protein n=1 Tax=Roseiconus lacunae TaxID=2605694 RepID=A0ABT7PL88_9BACT|nr:PmoA family protein [Roseiconus lacunae]MDM4017267.1 PmoA family protein [Roseiconus lacunae]
MNLWWRHDLLAFVFAITITPLAWCQSSATPDRVATHQILPVSQQAFEFQHLGQTKAVWHASQTTIRPYLFPLIGPSGQSVTRMGHPGAPDHDHHRSVWFAHHSVDGMSYWSENGGTRIQQKQWYAIEDGAEACRLATNLEWIATDGTPHVNQDLIIELIAGKDNEFWIDVQTEFRAAEGRETVTFDQSNFGIFAVRVSKQLSQVFGGGTLTSDTGDTGEPALFEKPHRWVDYSGNTTVYHENQSDSVPEGITYFDHPTNPGFPNRWHVRKDGWMCASPTMTAPIIIDSDSSLQLRYRLSIHRGGYDPNRAAATFKDFAAQKPWSIERSKRPHIRYELVRQ